MSGYGQRGRRPLRRRTRGRGNAGHRSRDRARSRPLRHRSRDRARSRPLRHPSQGTRRHRGRGRGTRRPSFAGHGGIHSRDTAVSFTGHGGVAAAGAPFAGQGQVAAAAASFAGDTAASRAGSRDMAASVPGTRQYRSRDTAASRAARGRCGIVSGGSRGVRHRSRDAVASRGMLGGVCFITRGCVSLHATRTGKRWSGWRSLGLYLGTVGGVPPRGAPAHVLRWKIAATRSFTLRIRRVFYQLAASFRLNWRIGSQTGSRGFKFPPAAARETSVPD